MRPSVNRAVRQFFQTTTLHGFKYCLSKYYVDRVGWAVCGVASACCAGVLCVVLWARFLQVPALLALEDSARTADHMPAVMVCPPVESVADLFIDKLSPNKSLTNRLPITLHRLLSGRITNEDQLIVLDQLLLNNNTTLRQVIMEYTPKCSEVVKRCRYQKTKVACGTLFAKEMVSGGLCCVMRPDKLPFVSTRNGANFQSSEMLEMVLQCATGTKVYGCEFKTMYESEEWVDPVSLAVSHHYMAQLRFSAITENAGEKLVQPRCVSDKYYTKTNCMLKCAEKSCGCIDPFTYDVGASNDLPPCSVSRLGCLKAFGYKNNISCQCRPSCKKITTYTVLQASAMDLVQHVIDPFFKGINVSASTVVNLRVDIEHSRMFVLIPTETWLTLLSSLGGVFNMFLGVGLFSALEFLYFMFVKLPLAVKKSSRIYDTTTPVTVY